MSLAVKHYETGWAERRLRRADCTYHSREIQDCTIAGDVTTIGALTWLNQLADERQDTADAKLGNAKCDPDGQQPSDQEKGNPDE